MATIRYTNYADYVYATNYSGDNTFYLLKGEDYFQGSYNRDTVYGFDGADRIYGSDGNDTLYGETGSDWLSGGAGYDRLFGGTGNDNIDGSGYYADRDEIYGGLGSDTITFDNDVVSAGDGNDKLHWQPDYGDNATVTLGLGSDVLSVYAGENYFGDYNDMKVLDFKAADRLNITGYDYEGYFYNRGQMLDMLDANDDGWLGAKDVAAQQYDYDNVDVHVGANYLELDVFESTIILQGMTKASFDFLS